MLQLVQAGRGGKWGGLSPELSAAAGWLGRAAGLHAGSKTLVPPVLVDKMPVKRFARNLWTHLDNGPMIKDIVLKEK